MPVDEAEDYDADGGDGGDGSMDTGNMIHAALLLFLLLWIGRPQCREMCVEFCLYKHVHIQNVRIQKEIDN